MSWQAGLWLFGPAIAWAGVAAVTLVATATDESAWGEVNRRAAGTSGSEDCRRCHPGEYESWHRSYHRTMTQPVSEDAVLAPFAGEWFEYRGFRASMTRRSDGTPHLLVETLADGTTLLDADVEYTIGSHRYQQYVARMDRGGGAGELWRLPVAWHLGEKRWIHMNGAFVEPEAEIGDAEGYLRHLSRWNDNCMFCHNTEPVPGKQADGHFESEVAELGIACEACHGPAGAHVARHENPMRRMLGGDGDASIAHPGRMGTREESGVCGRCHGQRIGKDVARILRDGDGFLPGTPLANVSRPIFRDSSIGGDPGHPFEARFWPDGTPRLSAYEYQGLLSSPCYRGGDQEGNREGERGLGCNHCHDMHGPEPSMQLREGRDSEGACVDCHAPAKLAGADSDGGHGGHGKVAPEVDCLDCHMPRTTYGLLQGIISHRITNPDPGAWVGRNDQPDACTQCHVDASRSWAAETMSQLGLSGSAGQGEAPEETVVSRVALDLVGGDPLQRNLAAHALSRPKATGSARTKMAWLAGAMDDEYPSVRWFAWRGLRDLAGRDEDAALLELLEGFDYLGEPQARIPITAQLRERLGPGALDGHPELRERLEDERADKAIWIGE